MDIQARRRASGTFVEMNCSSMTGNLLAGELFGHVRGAFTTAYETRQGLLDVADGGTLFLDEIGGHGPRGPGAVLKVLEEKRYRSIGDVKEKRKRSSDLFPRQTGTWTGMSGEAVQERPVLQDKRIPDHDPSLEGEGRRHPRPP